MIVNLARRLSTTLVSLKLSHCSQISDTALGALAKHCTNLTHLHLNRSLETADGFFFIMICLFCFVFFCFVCFCSFHFYFGSFGCLF